MNLIELVLTKGSNYLSNLACLGFFIFLYEQNKDSTLARKGENMYTPFSELSIFDKASTIALYLTVTLIAIMLVVGFFIKKSQKDMKTFNNITIGVCVGYSIGIIAILLFLKLDEYISKGYIDKSTFIPVLILLCLIIVLAVSALIISLLKPNLLKKFSLVSFGVIGAGLLSIFIVSLVKLYKGGGSLGIKSEVLLYVLTAIIVTIIVAIAFVFGKKNAINNTKSIVYAGICIATSFALSYIRFFSLPQGGSVTFASLVPLMIYSYMFGIRKGLIAGIIYGFLQFIQAPWFIHPIQFLLDYPIAFGAIGLTGLFNEKNLFKNKAVLSFALSAIIAVVIRYFSHVISGIFVFGSGDPENYGAVAWSFLYNSFVFADLAIALVASCALISSKYFLKTMKNAIN